MTDKEMSSVDSLKASFKSGVPPMPEAFSHLIDEAYRAYEIIDGDKRDGPTAGLGRDDKGKLALNTHHSGGLNLDQRALALSLKLEGGLSFDGGRRLKLDADRQVQFADFFSLSRWERMEIAQLLGLKRSTTMMRIVSPSPKENERFGTSVSLNAAGDCLVVGMGKELYLYMSRKGEWNTSAPIVFEADGDKYRSASWSVSLDAEGDNLAVGYSTPTDTQTMEVCLYMRTHGVWDTKNPIVFPIKRSYGDYDVNVSLSAAGDCLVVAGDTYPFYVYTRTNGIWDRENPIQLRFSNVGATICLSASGNCLAVHGSYYSDRTTINMVYVCTRTNGTWDESYIRFNPPEDSSPGFGKVFSLNAEGDRLAVGADDDSPIINGKVYLYTRTNGIWDTQNPIKFSVPASGVTYFGCAIKLNDAGDRLAVGAASRVYVYTYLNGKWNMETPTEILDPSGNLDNLNGFGKAVSLNKLGTSLAVGAVLAKVGSAPEAGAVYTFEKVK
ncbi:hypothetical protein CKY12_14255 [Photorhabdus sp. S12-55]|uniref:Photorhabdus luminescens subsp. laumondii TTO1 complete genome segment 7/17 n=2 Tax=Photorhabdus laumondii subsp. laumondii TaxID=141679 RepID=Q7N5P4_PHOLL|nr:hypothetical protein [Photorhabdus laumondii]RAW64753.1 hypothetical protein CKY15_22575 [Photorhabdus sp. S7-51]RAW66244.1 hypothetical protein CKY14_22635 [Photorhabdus sp. S14-60]RAW71407.1 hypothetical protein CKY06_22630 [Photorhabdus sp. S15-56]RAW83756.1 hypothetical protein CKY12_14255 [Photorhabdus sp. S12-55]RAW83849.1 hypothetical protein CKY09_13985 [Photorhabdus sp. S5P8-50]CAE14195.1 unnamed protein product [Photorhabdus laumondii subsp. laumondii TTO1]